MLVLTRKEGQSIIINNDITVKIISHRYGTVKIGIMAPADIVIDREEIHKKKEIEKYEWENGMPCSAYAEPYVE